MIIIGKVIGIDAKEFKYTIQPEGVEGEPITVLATVELTVSEGNHVMVFGRSYSDEKEGRIVVEDKAIVIDEDLAPIAGKVISNIWNIYGTLISHAKEQSQKETGEAIDELVEDDTTEGGDEE